MKGTGKESEEVNGDGKRQVFGEAALSVFDFKVITAEAVIRRFFPIIECAQNVFSHPGATYCRIGKRRPSSRLWATRSLESIGFLGLCLYIGLERGFWETV